MNRDDLVNRIVAEFRGLEQELQRNPDDWPQSSGQWTKEVLLTFCKLGRELGYTVWATGNSPNLVPDEWRDGGEFLYDASWHESDNCGRTISLPMVAESEWGGLEEVEYDFQKLLLARAEVRVMVYYSKGLQRTRCDYDQKYRDRLCELVAAFNGKQKDTYLLVAYLDDDERGFKFKFYQITDQGSGNQPEIKEL